MDELIIQVLRGRGTPEEVNRVRAWRLESPRNEATYRDLAAIWAELPDLEIQTAPPSAASIISRAEAPPAIPLSSRRPKRHRTGLIALVAAALTGVVLLSAEAVRWMVGAPGPVLQIQQLSTGPAETLMTELSDGTTVFLAPNSSLRVAPTPGVREVWVEGRAFFGVAKHGANWPFVVRSDRGMAQVLGTRFEFSTEDGRLKVVVVDGEVDVTAAGEKVQLGPGEMGEARANEQPVVVAVENVQTMLDWMGQTIVFEETPFEKAAREIEMRYGAEVTIRGETLGKQTISGGFKNRSFDDMMTVICRVLSADCVIENSKAVVTARQR